MLMEVSAIIQSSSPVNKQAVEIQLVHVCRRVSKFSVFRLVRFSKWGGHVEFRWPLQVGKQKSTPSFPGQNEILVNTDRGPDQRPVDSMEERMLLDFVGSLS